MSRILTYIRRCTKDYLNRSEINCYKYMVAKDRPFIERFIWTICTVIWIIFAIWLVGSSYHSILRAPTVTSERQSRMPVVDIPFPAVAICSENRISRRALLQYAEFVYKK